MSTARLRTTVGDLPVLSGSLVLPLRGNWSGTFAAHSPTAPDEGSLVSLEFVREDGTQDIFAGVVRRRGISAGSVALSLTLAGGAGKLLGDLPPRDHAPGVTEIPAGVIARAICDDAGERLAVGVETALDGRTVHRWTRIAMPGRDALDLLADVLGWGWRVLADGTVWTGLETWRDFAATKYLAAIPDDAGATYSCDGAPIRPGVTLATPEGTRRIVEVVYTVAPGATRATVRAAMPGDPPPVRGSLELYQSSYGATVRAQAPDGSLVLVPDDPRLGDTDRPLRGVQLRCGIPGARIVYQAPAGERVRVAFEGADPRGVYAFAHDQADAGATVRGVARVGDHVDGGTLTGLADVVTGIVAFTYTSGNPGASTVVAPSISISGIVTSGSPEVLIR